MPTLTDDLAPEPARPTLPQRVRRLLDDERVAFVLMGGVNTAFAFAVFAGLQLSIGSVVGYIVVLLLTHVAGVLEAFTLYRWRVFKVRGNVLVDLLRFWSVNLGALGVNLLMLPLLVELCHLRPILAQVIVLLTVTTVTFAAHKHFSFRRTAA